MKNVKCYAVILILVAARYCNAQVQLSKDIDWKKLNHSHDLYISQWGPFSKKYAGISHIPEFKSGLRFDFSVITGLYRYKPIIPNVVLQNADYYPWKANDDLTRYIFRSEMAWKDQAYADVEYNIIDSSTVLVSVHCVNNTALPQSMDVNLMSYIDFPENFPDNAIAPNPNVRWTNAVDYKSLKHAEPGIRDNLVPDGAIDGEVRGNSYIDGRAIGPAFGNLKGSKLSYKVAIDAGNTEGLIDIVYRAKAGTANVFKLAGLANQTVELKGTGKFEQLTVPFKVVQSGQYDMIVEAAGNGDLEFNGFAILTNGVKQLNIIPNVRNFNPEVTENAAAKNVILKYKDFKNCYGIAWEEEGFRIRDFRNDELDIYLRRNFNNHTAKVFYGNQKGDFANVYIRPIELEAHDDKTIYAMVCTGDLNRVKERLKSFKAVKDEFVRRGEQASTSPSILPEGRKYQLGQDIMKATVLTNVLYPIYTSNSYIRHFTPGKWYNSLYTWDGGFIALALNEINSKMAAESINAYTTATDNQNAFIQHGTPLPVHIYAFYELWNKTQSRELLTYFYPRLKKYYEFLAGRYGSSVTRTFKSNILKTWDYNYNSGGWDDYPPQVTLHELKAENTVAPVVNTAHSIRLAKMLKMAALALGNKQDVALYDNDITVFSQGLQKYSWNDSSGYFSYVVHDQNGNPVGHFKHPASQTDHNMGLDGAYPLLSGICTKKQEDILLDKIFSEKHMWTPSGICVVDQSAPYFQPVGYWNGSVWMPHQWFMWKTMLDLGHFDLAKRIADKALDIYKREVDATYSTFEYYSAKTGRGAGWNQFGGLTAPVINWFASYFKPGTVSAGFEIWISKQQFNTNFSTYQSTFVLDNSTAPHQRSFLVCMNPNYKYQVYGNNKALAVNSPYPGLLQITLPASNQDISIDIVPQI